MGLKIDPARGVVTKVILLIVGSLVAIGVLGLAIVAANSIFGGKPVFPPANASQRPR